MRVWIVALAVLLAGCADEAAPDDIVVEPVPEELSAVDVNATVNATGVPTTEYALSHGNQSYLDSVSVLVIEATENLTYDLKYDASWPSVTTEAHCMFFGVNEETPRSSFAAWSSPANLRASLRVDGDGTSYDAVPTPDQTAGIPITTDMGGEGGLLAGEHLYVMMGGSDPAVFSHSGTVDPFGTFSMTVVGTHNVSQQQWPLRCGVGAQEADDSTVGATFYLNEVEVGGSVSLETHNATTAFVVPGFDLADTNELELRVANEAYTPSRPMGVTSPEAGMASLTFVQEVSTLSKTAWMFVDAELLVPES